MIRGLRGAITVKENTEEEIISATERLLRQMIEKNNLQPNDVASVFFSVTDEISATFPARALRLFEGWAYVPVMCMREISVPSALTHCIRVMMHVNTDKAQDEMNHIYLDGAVILRPDLIKK
ncbi:chorismate mutase [Bacillus methanolicus MGA3]|uniref:chorismate mutase n=1 Tax=Bacillus methanolicus (strain MGA3 / ATCC 53907) TaxID=796606 RepID=A0A068LU91_BACMM|nr:chorismate mutase [Bacillus methanolicus]AIE60543.1 chorismate mutase [Bacillus methanolicus MGA3]